MDKAEPIIPTKAICEILKILKILNKQETEQLWKSLAQDAKDLTVVRRTGTKNHNNPTHPGYNALTQAIAYIKRGSDSAVGGRTRPSKKSDGWRQMSGKELQDAVFKYQDRLLEQPDAASFLMASIHDWVRIHKVDLLGVVGSASPNDTPGVFKDSLPSDAAPSRGKEAILDIALQDTDANLALAELASTQAVAQSQVLSAMAVAVPSSPAQMPLTEAAPMWHDKSSSSEFIVDSAFLLQLSDDMAALRRKLLHAAETLASEVYPEEAQTVCAWQALGVRISLACQALDTSLPSVPELKVALGRVQSQAAGLGLLARCRLITHRTKPDIPGLMKIRIECDRLEEMVRQGSTQINEFEGARALLELVANREKLEELDEDRAVELSLAVRASFGNAVDVMALCGNLLLASDEPPLPGPPGGGKQVQPSPMTTHAQAPQAVGAEQYAFPTMAIPNSPVAAHERIAPEPEPEPEPAAAVEHASKPKPKPKTKADDTIPVVASVDATAVGEPALQIPTPTVTPEPEVPAAVEPAIEQAIEAAPAPVSSAPLVCATQAPAVQTAAAAYEHFADFRQRHWIDAAGKVMPAPWIDPDFGQRLDQAALAAWGSHQFALAFVFARAAETLQLPCALDAQVLDWVNRLLEAPSNPLVSRASSQSAPRTVLRQALAGAPMTGLLLMLEALRPTPDQPPTLDDINNAAAFKNPALNEIVSFLLHTRAKGQDPLAALRFALLNGAAPTVTSLEENLKSAQESLRSVVNEMWTAAGGRIHRPHSRQAWTKFRTEVVVPLRDEIAPKGAGAGLSLMEIAPRVQRFVQKFQAIMIEVKHEDRKHADRAAKEIVQAIQKVMDALQQLAGSQQRRTPHAGAVKLPSLSDTRRLLATDVNDPSLDPAGLLCVLILRAELQDHAPTNPLRLGAEKLYAHPDLLRFIEPDTLSGTDLVKSGINVQAISHPVAASVLFMQGKDADEEFFESTRELLDALRLSAVDHERMDILSALSCTQVLHDNERSELRQQAFDLGGAIYVEAAELKKLWVSCDELVTPGAASLTALLVEANNIMGRDDGDLPVEEAMLLGSWLHEQRARALAERDAMRQALLAQINTASADSQETSDRVQAYFEAGNDRAALSLINHNDDPVRATASVGCRRTLWRSRALQAFVQARTRLATPPQAGEPPEQGQLMQLWLACGSAGMRATPDHIKQRDGLHKLLYLVASGEASRRATDATRRIGTAKGRLTKLRDFRDRKTIVDCSEIRHQFQANGLTPTFLPQLATVFHKLVLMALPADSGTAVPLTLNTLAQLVDAESAQSLVVFLAPGLSPLRRDELGQGLRQRGLTAALFDDVDMCRLLDADQKADGHDFVALLEIALEQLDLDRVTPFSTQDGQHVQLETYIGRKENALRVALGSDYTRIFSGRKLGKSAFLRYVASTHDKYEMISGNLLHIFFINIAGSDSEQNVVERIIEAMNKRFAPTPTQEGCQLTDAAERFSAYIKRFVVERPKDNVLLVLDEADLFVEGQLAAYESVREKSLSFRMMKEVTGELDEKSQIPRIRTILSGYRVTHTRGGVWANAGDVLVLKPLTEDEAVLFLCGMLARIGVDLGEHAPFIARRCGFQPAVLIRFGECLLRRLKAGSRTGGRETIIVDHLDVTSTLNDPGVLDEIRTVVNNNFQGNRVAGAVFGATLLALKDLAPGLSLTDGPSQVLDKLKKIDPVLEWLDSSGTQAEAQVERYLREFIDRELLMMTPASRIGEREYRLCIPHFLPVLTQATEVAQEVRKQIQAIRSGGIQAKAPESMLSESALELVRYCFHENNDIDLCKMVVISGQWPEALLDKRGGVPDRLGCNASAIAQAPDANKINALAHAGVRIFSGMKASAWQALMDTPATKSLVVIGSLDLLRVAQRYDMSGEMPRVEVLSIGRLDSQTIAWWFERIRALHFRTADAFALIEQLTEGIPLLVRHFDSCLPQASGEEISVADFSAAERLFNERLPACAALLTDPASDARLTARELQLLDLANKIAKDGDEEFDLDHEFELHYDMLEPALRGNAAAPMSQKEDGLCLEILTKTGLLQRLPTGFAANAPLGRVKMRTGSVIARLLAQLECGVAG